MNTYDRGDATTLQLDLTDTDGAPSDADVELQVMPPGGPVQTFSGGQLANPTIGRYERTITLDECGLWRHRFEATGDVVAAEEGVLRVRSGAFD